MAKKAPRSAKSKVKAAKAAKDKRRAAAAAKNKATRPSRPRQAALGGMEDSRIQELDDIAASYGDIRDQRQMLTKEESEKKALAISLMKKHGKTIYRHDGIEIVLKTGEDDVKVKYKPQADVDAVDDDGGDDDAGEGAEEE